MSAWLLVLVFAGGMLTILSPCILPVLPFVLTRADRRIATQGLPLLIGMAGTFAAVASLAAVGGGWAVRLNETGRWIALALLAVFALTLLSPTLAERLNRPLVALGNRLVASTAAGPGGPAGSGGPGGPGGPADPKGPEGPAGPGAARAATAERGILTSLLIGVATGLLWAPCAGPILGLVLTGAALSGPSAHTTLLLFAYAAGAALSLTLALLAGGRVLGALKRSLGAGEWVRRSLGIAVLMAVAGIALGLDASVLTRWSLAGTQRLEHALLAALPVPPVPGAQRNGAPDAVAAPGAMGSRDGPVDGADVAPGITPTADGAPSLGVEGLLPELGGASGWINSAPLSAASLRGHVVLVDFWTYSCINCLRALPYVKSWYARYKDRGLIVIGVHAPEFAFERDPANVERAVRELGIAYPVALDDRYALWRAFSNEYWPAHYFIDAEGRIRAHHFGEGEYAESERILRTLLREAGHDDLPSEAGMPATPGSGVEAAADLEHVASPETYLGYRRAEHFRSPGGLAADQEKRYVLPAGLAPDEWALEGRWIDDHEKAQLHTAPGIIEFRFSARDLHLVLGPGARGHPVRFRVRLDGAPPGDSHGMDVDAGGNGVVRDQRLYQLIRQPGPIGQHTFSIEFLDPEVQAYAFTFG